MTEKIQWYKINYKNPLIVKCADKFEVRNYIRETIGEKYLVPLVFHTRNYKEVKPENFPDYPIVIKANHTSGTTHFVRNKKEVDWQVIQTDCRWWLHLNYYYTDKEWQYENIEPRIVVEKMLTDEDGSIPSDYKLHCFNGKFEFLQVDLGRFGTHRRNIYDRNWELLPFTFSMLDKHRNPKTPRGRSVDRPKNLELLIDLAETLAKPFPYVRVDFYVIKDNIFFGELTFHHGGGYEQFTPDKWDLYYGNKIPLIKG
ncbi:ATP-grasp fold amidoligase family protein [Gelidibacter mesophilus]|uniref:ATP-grasp fold amidoligase family protein n=1 Tax=Gelidibacter mesophilus TaxID=169050 RepID=UPI00146D34B0|nr:ATP-grasp fold amidoligase family protein [Gelidibacter mesophilus]